MNFKTELQERTDFAEAVIEKYLPEEHGFSGRMAEAVNYSMRAGGKRLRPVFMRDAYQILGGEGEIIEPFMAALEMVHTHSLIHDDLPCMDDDDYRRGRLSCHKKFSQANALLAGDALLTLAFKTITDAFYTCGVGAEACVKAVKTLAEKAGADGMVGGQVIDLENENKEINEKQLKEIHLLKTSALIEAACMLGVIAAEGSEDDINNAREYGENLGLAFQTVDDVLSVTGSAEKLGKPTENDEGKVTYITLLSLDGARRKADEYTQNAMSVLDRYTNVGILKEYSLYLLKRDR